MAIDVTTFLRDKLKELNIPVTHGTVLSDLFLTPLKKVLEDYEEFNRTIINKYSNLENLDNADLDFIGSRFFISRDLGSKATGIVNFYYKNPVNIQLVKDSILVHNDLKYKIINNYTILKNSFNMENGLYKSPDITIEALDYGDAYNLPANESFKFDGIINVKPDKILNSSEISGGVNTETDEEFIDRLRRSIYGDFLGSPAAIESLLKSNFPSISSVMVLSSDSSIMVRDLVYNISDINTINKITYKYVKHGPVTENYDLLHKAYLGTFTGLSINSDGSLEFPNITDFIIEFNDNDYKNISQQEDLLYSEITNLKLLENFNQEGWIKLDVSNFDLSIKHEKDIVVSDTSVTLGRTATKDTSYISTEVIGNIINELESLDSIEHISTLTEQYGTLVNDKENYNNISPVYVNSISQFRGISINVDVITTDSSETGSTSYITVLKNNSKFSAYDGYGIAWRKQPEYLIRMQRNEYENTVEGLKQKNADIEKFNIENNRTDGIDFLGRLYGEDQHPEATSVWKYNIYVVDNNFLDEEVFIANGQVWLQAAGKNQFLAAGKYWIEHDITYNFEIQIGENLGINLFIDKETNTTPVLVFGPTYPNYIPNSLQIIDGEEVTYNNFGISVLNTRNYTWTYSNLLIESIVNSLPGHLFKLDVSNFTITNSAKLVYSGFCHATTGSSKLQVGIYNFNTGEFELLGIIDTPAIPEDYTTLIENYTITVTLDSLTDYVDENNFIYIEALGANVDDTEHIFRTYYIELNDSDYIGTHKGNYLDIYTYIPNDIRIAETSEVISNNKINLYNNTNFNPYVIDVIEITELATGLIIPQNSWKLGNNFNERGYELSNQNKVKIYFDSAYNNLEVKIKYHYLSTGSKIQDFINNDDFRQPAVNYLLKAFPITIVKISKLMYKGSINVNNLVNIIIDYITKLDKIFDKYLFINYLYTINGIDYIDPDIIIDIIEYDVFLNKKITKNIKNQYTIASSNISKFYTNNYYLSGILNENI